MSSFIGAALPWVGGKMCDLLGLQGEAGGGSSSTPPVEDGEGSSGVGNEEAPSTTENFVDCATTGTREASALASSCPPVGQVTLAVTSQLRNATGDVDISGREQHEQESPNGTFRAGNLHPMKSVTSANGIVTPGASAGGTCSVGAAPVRRVRSRASKDASRINGATGRVSNTLPPLKPSVAGATVLHTVVREGAGLTSCPSGHEIYNNAAIARGAPSFSGSSLGRSQFINRYDKNVSRFEGGSEDAAPCESSVARADAHSSIGNGYRSNGDSFRSVDVNINADNRVRELNPSGSFSRSADNEGVTFLGKEAYIDASEIAEDGGDTGRRGDGDNMASNSEERGWSRRRRAPHDLPLGSCCSHAPLMLRHHMDNNEGGGGDGGGGISGAPNGEGSAGSGQPSREPNGYVSSRVFNPRPSEVSVGGSRALNDESGGDGTRSSREESACERPRRRAVEDAPPSTRGASATSRPPGMGLEDAVGSHWEETQDAGVDVLLEKDAAARDGGGSGDMVRRSKRQEGYKRKIWCWKTHEHLPLEDESEEYCPHRETQLRVEETARRVQTQRFLPLTASESAVSNWPPPLPSRPPPLETPPPPIETPQENLRVGGGGDGSMFSGGECPTEAFGHLAASSAWRQGPEAPVYSNGVLVPRPSLWGVRHDGSSRDNSNGNGGHHESNRLTHGDEPPPPPPPGGYHEDERRLRPVSSLLPSTSNRDSPSNRTRLEPAPGRLAWIGDQRLLPRPSASLQLRRHTAAKQPNTAAAYLGRLELTANHAPMRGDVGVSGSAWTGVGASVGRPSDHWGTRYGGRGGFNAGTENGDSRSRRGSGGSGRRYSDDTITLSSSGMSITSGDDSDVNEEEFLARQKQRNGDGARVPEYMGRVQRASKSNSRGGVAAADGLCNGQQQWEAERARRREMTASAHSDGDCYNEHGGLTTPVAAADGAETTATAPPEVDTAACCPPSGPLQPGAGCDAQLQGSSQACLGVVQGAVKSPVRKKRRKKSAGKSNGVAGPVGGVVGPGSGNGIEQSSGTDDVASSQAEGGVVSAVGSRVRVPGQKQSRPKCKSRNSRRDAGIPPPPIGPRKWPPRPPHRALEYAAAAETSRRARGFTGWMFPALPPPPPPPLRPPTPPPPPPQSLDDTRTPGKGGGGAGGGAGEGGLKDGGDGSCAEGEKKGKGVTRKSVREDHFLGFAKDNPPGRPSPNELGWLELNPLRTAEGRVAARKRIIEKIAERKRQEIMEALRIKEEIAEARRRRKLSILFLGMTRVAAYDCVGGLAKGKKRFDIIEKLVRNDVDETNMNPLRDTARVLAMEALGHEVRCVSKVTCPGEGDNERSRRCPRTAHARAQSTRAKGGPIGLGRFLATDMTNTGASRGFLKRIEEKWENTTFDTVLLDHYWLPDSVVWLNKGYMANDGGLIQNLVRMTNARLLREDFEMLLPINQAFFELLLPHFKDLEAHFTVEFLVGERLEHLKKSHLALEADELIPAEVMLNIYGKEREHQVSQMLGVKQPTAEVAAVLLKYGVASQHFCYARFLKLTRNSAAPCKFAVSSAAAEAARKSEAAAAAVAAATASVEEIQRAEEAFLAAHA